MSSRPPLPVPHPAWSPAGLGGFWVRPASSSRSTHPLRAVSATGRPRMTPSPLLHLRRLDLARPSRQARFAGRM